MVKVGLVEKGGLGLGIPCKKNYDCPQSILGGVINGIPGETLIVGAGVVSQGGVGGVGGVGVVGGAVKPVPKRKEVEVLKIPSKK